MEKASAPATRRLHALLAFACVASLVACGGGSGSSPTAGPTPPPPPPPPPPPATALFAAPVGSAASSVQLSNGDTTARFTGITEVAVRSDTAQAPGASKFYYFEATRSAATGVAMGVSVSADALPASGGSFTARPDTLVVQGTALVTADASGNTVTRPLNDAPVFGFAVDLRDKYPIVSVVGPARGSVACGAVDAEAPCILQRMTLARPATSLYLYAYGQGDGSTGPTVTLNTGADLAALPFAYDVAQVRALLRVQRYAGDRDLLAQWPSATGPAPTPVLSRSGYLRAVVRLGDATPYRATLQVSATGLSSGSTITWKDEGGTVRGTGTALAIPGALTAGEHTLTASTTDATTGRHAEVSYTVRVLASGDNGDDDGDGLTYDQEKALGLDPGNPDTDGDGLSDGAEAGLGKNPALADNSAGTGLPRPVLTQEFGKTSRGLIASDDGLSAAFTDDLNQDCLQHLGVFAELQYGVPGQDSGTEHCRKRAMRANVGVKPGEFRYFETHRLNETAGTVNDPLPNLGHGLIGADAQIDPYCCYVYSGQQPGPYPYTGTPSSMAVNSAGGVFVNLRNDNLSLSFSPAGMDLGKTVYYGFAVDYRGSTPVVYVVGRAADNSMTVSTGITLSDFAAGADIMPMVYGHPLSNTTLQVGMNLGATKFHYDLTALRTALTAQGAANVSQLVPGVGVHRWP